MKKFTFIAMLLAVFAMTAKAELMEVQNKKNGGRMLNYFCNEAAWNGVDPATLPNSTYKFTMDLNMSNMAARADMEFTLLPVGICTPTDNRVSTHNYHWYKVNDGDDYFFRWRVGEKPAAANGDFTIWINEEPTAKNDWTQTTEETLTISSQKTYKFAVEINVAEKTATYTIADEEGTVLKTGVHKYTCAEDRAGIFVFGMNGTSTHQLSNIGLCYAAEGPFATEPNADLFAASLTERDYYVNIAEGNTLHWIQLGNATGVDGTEYVDGEEYSVSYSEAIDTREFETDEENPGSKIIYCTKPGDLKMWTVLDENDAKSMDVVIPVTCEKISMPTPVATITNVEEGFAKEYTISADNSNTLLTPEVTINCVVKDAAGKAIETKDVMPGEVIKMTEAGSLELYAYDGTHPSPWYEPSETVTQKNNAEYVVAEVKNYAWSKDECDATKAGFTVTEIVDAANKSHWDRVYSDQKYGYDENGNASAWVDGTEYASVKEGFGFYPGTSIGTADAKWNVQVPEDATTAFAPLAPTADLIANSKYVATAWGIFPNEGIVYYNTAITNAPVTLDAKYTSDDASKPNFYIVHTRGGYDRPDKGDCNATTVCVAGEPYNLYRYDTAICDVKVMTYKGFTPNTTGISSVNAAEVAAPAVKKVMTKDGLVIVKGNKTFSLSGAQMK